MADRALIEQAAAKLHAARATGTPITPLRELFGTGDDGDIGYAIQEINTEKWIAEGRRLTGRKIGLTSKAVQAQMGVGQPDFGMLYADMEFGDGVPLPAARLMQPRAEAEVALVLDRDLNSAPHGFAEIMRATAFVVPALEIVDSAIADWSLSFLDTVADNASSGLYVLGGKPVLLRDIDLRAIPMQMLINGAEVSSGAGANCLSHPLNAARWLADTMCMRGAPLKAGDVVMTGALGPMRPLATGDTVVAHFGELGSVSTSVEG